MTSLTKANVVLPYITRGFSNVQVTIQAANPHNKNQVGQLLLSIDLNCAPQFANYAPGSTGTTPQNRLLYPPTPIKGVQCDGNYLSNPMPIGIFTVSLKSTEKLNLFVIPLCQILGDRYR